MSDGSCSCTLDVTKHRCLLCLEGLPRWVVDEWRWWTRWGNPLLARPMLLHGVPAAGLGGAGVGLGMFVGRRDEGVGRVGTGRVRLPRRRPDRPPRRLDVVPVPLGLPVQLLGVGFPRAVGGVQVRVR